MGCKNIYSLFFTVGVWCTGAVPEAGAAAAEEPGDGTGRPPDGLSICQSCAGSGADSQGSWVHSLQGGRCPAFCKGLPHSCELPST